MSKKYSGVYISSGHSAYLPGAVGNGHKEHDVAAKFVDTLFKKLVARGVKVYKYHDNNAKSVPANLNNICGKHIQGGNKLLHISVHLNSGPANATGSEVLYRGDMGGVADDFSDLLATTLGITNRGKKLRTDLGFLNTLSLRGFDPILIELCFISNKHDITTLLPKMDVLADKVANKIAKYCGVSSQSEKKADNKKYHTVVKGDTLYDIANKYNTNVDKIKKLNPKRLGKSNVIQGGWTIRVK